MSDSDTQPAEVFAQIAAALAAGDDLHGLLRDLLMPMAQQSRARAASVSVHAPEAGQLQQLGAIELGPAGAGQEFAVQVPLRFRGRSLGQYELLMPSGAVIGEPIACFHRTVGALLGWALHGASVERESRQAVLAEVHDGVAQSLLFARMRLPLLESAISSGDEAQALRCCSELRQVLGSAHSNVRAILAQGHVPMHPLGLRHALSSSIQSFREQTQVNLIFDDRAPDLHLSRHQESQVFLIVQEALANIAKHARAHHAWLHIAQRGDQVVVDVEDDGAGAPASATAAPPSHFGIAIMRQRAARLGGQVEIKARDGGGMRLRLLFPTTEAAIA